LGFYIFAGRPDPTAVEARLDALLGTAKPPSAPSAPAGMSTVIGQLQEKVRANPKDPDAWGNLGWSYMHIHDPAKAADAYRQAAALSPANPDYRSALAEATIQSGSGKIAQSTLVDLKAVVAADPANARARFYLALYKDQQGDHQGAIADWIEMIKSAPADAPWTGEVRQVVEQVAKEEHIDISKQLPPAPAPAAAAAMPGPDEQQGAAASQMPAAERNAMIHGMVDRLAAQLAQNPHDADGWQRLMRARMVLGEKTAALDAYRSARKAFAHEPEQLTGLDSAAQDLGIGSKGNKNNG
jgi:cytochrome c-type biogenesis protein CcmH